jgi:hypothetical protein
MTVSKRERMPEFNVPSNATVDRLNQIIVGWYRSKAHESPVPNAEVTKRTGVPETEVSRQNGFFQDVGLLAKESNMFRLTALGTEYAKFLDYGQLEEAKSTLRKVFRQWSSFQQVFDYVDLKGPLSKEDFLARIGLAAEKKPSGGTRTGMIALIDLLLFAELLVQQDSLVGLNKQLFKEELTPELKLPVGEKTAPSSVRVVRGVPTSTSDLPLRLELTLKLDNTLDLVKLKEFLKAIREVLLEGEP